LVVDVQPGSVHIEPWSKDEVFVQAENIDERYPDRLQMTQSDNTITVKYRDRRWSGNDIRFTINVPVEFNANIKTSGGSVQEKDVLKGSFDVDTRGGSVDIEEIDGRVDARTGGGSIRVEKIDGDAKLKTGGGSVKAKLVTGETEVESGGGSLRMDKVGKGLKLDTGGGSISVGDVGGDATVHTGGGSIEIGSIAQKLVASTGGGGVEVEGASGANNVRTGGGSVSLKNITGSISLKTGGGSITVELKPNGTGNSNISTGGGDIRLYIPETAKAVVEATLNLRWGWGNARKRYRISSDFKADKFQQDEDEGSSFAVYTLNGGGDKIELETTNGNIEILKLKK
jgi:DUF4097 and DUF4098 domain-containing protein YvlB